MGLSIGHVLVVLVLVLVVFGAGKLPKVMGDLGKGMHNFKEGLKGAEGDLKTSDHSNVEIVKNTAELEKDNNHKAG